MPNLPDVSDLDQNFLIKLHQMADGDTAKSISMYDLGAAIGLDRDAAKKAAEHLMGHSWVEIRTLSGAIGLSQEGLNRLAHLGVDTPQGKQAVVRLGNSPLVADETKEAVMVAAAALKLDTPQLALAFDALAELVADVQTLNAQLASPKPKTAIVRACLESIKTVLNQAEAGQALPQINELLS